MNNKWHPEKQDFLEGIPTTKFLSGFRLASVKGREAVFLRGGKHPVTLAQWLDIREKWGVTMSAQELQHSVTEGLKAMRNWEPSTFISGPEDFARQKENLKAFLREEGICRKGTKIIFRSSQLELTAKQRIEVMQKFNKGPVNVDELDGFEHMMREVIVDFSEIKAEEKKKAKERLKENSENRIEALKEQVICYLARYLYIEPEKVGYNIYVRVPKVDEKNRISETIIQHSRVDPKNEPQYLTAVFASFCNGMGRDAQRNKLVPDSLEQEWRSTLNEFLDEMTLASKDTDSTFSRYAVRLEIMERAMSYSRFPILIDEPSKIGWGQGIAFHHFNIDAVESIYAEYAEKGVHWIIERCPTWMSWLKLNNHNPREGVYDSGACFCAWVHLMMSNRKQKMREQYYITGAGRTGNTSVGKALLKIFGPIGTAFVDVGDTDTHTSQKYVGKYLAVGSETKSRRASVANMTKLISGNDTTTINPKFGATFDYNIHLVLVHFSNRYPAVNMYDTSEVSRTYAMLTNPRQLCDFVDNAEEILAEEFYYFYAYCSIIYHKYNPMEGGLLKKPKDMERYLWEKCSTEATKAVKSYFDAVTEKAERTRPAQGCEKPIEQLARDIADWAEIKFIDDKTNAARSVLATLQAAFHNNMNSPYVALISSDTVRVACEPDILITRKEVDNVWA